MPKSNYVVVATDDNIAEDLVSDFNGEILGGDKNICTIYANQYEAARLYNRYSMSFKNIYDIRIYIRIVNSVTNL